MSYCNIYLSVAEHEKKKITLIFSFIIFIFTQIVGTATRERIPDVPMFSTNPTKRSRRETLADTALNAEPAAAVQQVQNWSKQKRCIAVYIVNTPKVLIRLFCIIQGNTDTEKAHLRSEVIKQIKDLFDLKNLGAITEEEYVEKKVLLLKDL